MRRRLITVVFSVLLSVVLVSSGAEAKFKPRIVPVSVSAADPDVGPNDDSIAVSMSPNGRYALFNSSATDVLAGITDTNGAEDLYVRDLRTGTTRLISHTAGSQTTTADAATFTGSVADDGSVGYQTTASNIIASFTDSNGTNGDMYRWDPATGNNVLLTHLPGAPTTGGAGSLNGTSFSFDGTKAIVNYTKADLVNGTDHNALSTDVFLIDATASPPVATLVSHSTTSTTDTGDGQSDLAQITDGAVVVFRSGASDLSATNTGGSAHAWAYDVGLATLTLVTTTAESSSAANNDTDYVALSGNSRYVAVVSKATDLVAGFADNNGGSADDFLIDLSSGRRWLVTHRPGQPTSGTDGTNQFGPFPASDGTVLFDSDGDDLVPSFDDGNGTGFSGRDIYVFDHNKAKVKLVDHVFDDPHASVNAGITLAVNRDAKTYSHVFFVTDATDVVKNSDVSSPFGDLYRWSLSDGSVKLISHAFDDKLTGVGDVGNALGSAGGKSAVFSTDSSNLVDGFSTGGKYDAFAREGVKP